MACPLASLRLKSAAPSEEKNLKTTMDTVLDGLIIIDELGAIHSFNLAATRIFGYQPEEVIGKNIKMLMPESYHGKYDAYMDANQPQDMDTGHEMVGKRKDGSTFPMELGVGEMNLGEKRMFVGTVCDITERKASEQKLARQSKLLDAVRRAQAQFITSEDEIRVFEELLDDFITLSESDYGFISELLYTPDGKPYLTSIVLTDISWDEESKGLYNQLLDGSIASFNMQSLHGAVVLSGKPVIANDAPTDPRRTVTGLPHGHPPLNKFLGIPMFSRSNEMVAVLGLSNRLEGYSEDIIAYLDPMVSACTDLITARRSEQQRKRIEQDNKSYLALLKRSNQDLDEFAYIASHDLKEPLRGLSTNSMFLKEDYLEKLDAEGQKRLDRMLYLCERMEQLINDLLYFSRIGRQELAIQNADINTVIKDIELMIETVLQENNATIHIPKNLPTIVCDLPRITEAFRNLITNAIKYNDKEKKIIEVGYVSVSVPALDGSEQYAFYVKDNGMGIPEKFYKDIFRIFKRLNSEDDAKKGTGVGLTFVKKIVERHGGHIWIESEMGQGTTFYFTINKLEDNDDATTNDIVSGRQ